MKCNKGTDLVCTYWDKCENASACLNVPKGIKNKLNGEEFKREFVKQTKKVNTL